MHRSFCAKAILVIAAVFIIFPALANDNKPRGARPIKINPPVAKSVDDYSLEDNTPTDVTASPNPRIIMTLLGANGEPINQAIPLMEDSDTNIVADSEILGEQPPEIMDGMTFKNARWVGPPTIMWTIDDTRRKRTTLGNSKTYQFKAGFNYPGSYFLSCFIFRPFVYIQGDQERRLSAISSKGIACFVADCTPPSFQFKLTEYETNETTLVTCKETPVDQPFGSKTWEMYYSGIHFSPKANEKISGLLAGDLDRQTKIDLCVQKDPPTISIKKGKTYIIEVEAKDNYGVNQKEWSLMNPAKRNVLNGYNATSFTFPEEENFEGDHVLQLYFRDHGGNDLELKLPVKIIEKEQS
jgi:hypothetical protein